jgi:hypothetical protein
VKWPRIVSVNSSPAGTVFLLIQLRRLENGACHKSAQREWQIAASLHTIGSSAETAFCARIHTHL